MKRKKKQAGKLTVEREYEAPLLYVGFFYFLLAAWSLICIVLLGTKAIRIGWPIGQLLIIAFVVAYTWFFSLGISYKIRVDTHGAIEFVSVRRILSVSAHDIERVEGPRFTVIPYCFVRFRLEREKAYLFCRITDEALHRVFYALRRSKQDMKFKGLPMII